MRDNLLSSVVALACIGATFVVSSSRIALALGVLGALLALRVVARPLLEDWRQRRPSPSPPPDDVASARRIPVRAAPKDHRADRDPK